MCRETPRDSPLYIIITIIIAVRWLTEPALLAHLPRVRLRSLRRGLHV